MPNFNALTPVSVGTVADFSLAPRLRDDNFAFRFTGFISVPADGGYTFFTASDDGSSLSVGNAVVVDNGGLHSLQEKSGFVALKAGMHPITVTYFENVGSQNLAVRYAAQGIFKTAIPGGVLSHANPVAVFQDGFEANFDAWTAGGATDWDRTTAQFHAGTFSAHCGGSDNDLISDDVNTAGRSFIHIEVWYRDQGVDSSDDVFLQLYDGVSYDNKFELGVTSPENTWHLYSVTINNTGANAQYFHSRFRVKIEGTSVDSGENVWIDDVRISVQ
jgi:hypothetical protein